MYCQVFSHISELSPLEVNSVPLTNFDNPKCLQYCHRFHRGKGSESSLSGKHCFNQIDKLLVFIFNKKGDSPMSICNGAT